MTSSQIMMLISKIRESIHNNIVSELGKHGITDIEPAHGDIFRALSIHSELKMSELAFHTGRKKNTITVLARKLISRGYLQERLDPNDSRSRLLSLTNKTKEIEPIRKEVSNDILEKIYRGFDKQEKEEVINLLERIYKNVK